MSAVAIVMLSRGNNDVWAWLCPPALARREAEGWHIRDRKKAPAHTLTCEGRIDGCGCSNDRFGLPLPPEPTNQGAAT